MDKHCIPFTTFVKKSTLYIIKLISKYLTSEVFYVSITQATMLSNLYEGLDMKVWFYVKDIL